MLRTFAVARRILSQFKHDKRTIALLFVAPLFVLWLLSVLLGADSYEPRIATVDLPEEYQQVLETQDATVVDVDFEQAQRLLESNSVDAVLYIEEGTTLTLWAEGSDSTKTAAVAAVVSSAIADLQGETSDEIQSDIEDMQDSLSAFGFSTSDMFTFDLAEYMPVQDVDITYLHGSEDWKMFDFYGPVFIGIFVFVFVFITSGMSLVNERGVGTMTRFLASPIKPTEILGGYVLGFGLLALAQSIVILSVSIGLIGFPNEGNILLVVMITVSMALASVTLGLLVSGLASNAFQVIQLMLLFVVPQILLSGLFDLSSTPSWMQTLGQCFPVTYGVNALRAVMLRGVDFATILPDIAVVWGFIALFFVLATQGFKKKRAR